MGRFIYIFVFVGLLRSSLQRSSPQDDSYVAAVVEYEFSSETNTNMRNYLSDIRDASAQGADIIVFPELTLTRGVSIQIPMFGAIKEHPVPALRPELYQHTLVALSEAAISNQIYIVVNIEETMDCSSNETVGEYCPESKRYLFNTNVVFDRNGAIIDRYRKINLFGEYTRTPALQPDLGVFKTDFGVTFGHFICFDLMFQVPGVQVVEKMNITDVIFTTMWFSEMPFLTAVQIQQAYAYALNINFLGSGANNVRVGSAGSGIFSGKAGALISTMPGSGISRLLVQRVPKVPGQLGNITYPGPIYDPPSDADGFFMKQDPSLKAHVSKLLNVGNNEFVLSQGDVTCRFRVRMSRRDGEKGPKFRAFVHDGSNVYVRREIGVVSCAVVACEDEHNISSCPYQYNETEGSVFLEEVDIKMSTYRMPYNSTLKCDNMVYFPSSLQTNKYSLNPRNFTFIERKQNGVKQDGGRETVTMKLETPQNSLISFNIWARVYNRDVIHTGDVTEEEKISYKEMEDALLYGKPSSNTEKSEELNGDSEVCRMQYHYRASVFDGVRTFDGLTSGGSRMCAIIACTSTDLQSCGIRFDTYVENTTAVFAEMFIQASVPTPGFDSQLGAYDATYFPVSVDIHTQPLNTEDFTYTESVEGSRTIYEMSLMKLDVEMYSIAVWGRKYDTDGTEPTAPSSSVFHALNYVLMVPIMYVLIRD